MNTAVVGYNRPKGSIDDYGRTNALVGLIQAKKRGDIRYSGMESTGPIVSFLTNLFRGHKQQLPGGYATAVYQECCGCDF